MTKCALRVFFLAGTAVVASLAGPNPVMGKHPARGCLDARWDSGYALRSQGHHACGYFAVYPGCSGLVPTQYRSFADTVSTTAGHQRVGFSWYTGESWHADGGAAATETQPARPLAPAPLEAPVGIE